MMVQNKEKYLTIGDIWNIVRKNIVLMALITTVIFVVGTVYTFVLVEEEYKASSTIVVAIKNSGNTSQEGVDYSNGLKVISTISQLCKEDIVLLPVSRQYSQFTISEIRQMISVTSSNTSYIIKVNGVSTNKQIIASIVDSVVDSLLDQCANENNKALYELIGTSLQQTSNAQDLGASYHSPNKPLYILVSLFGGFIVAVGVVFIKELFSNTFSNKKDVESVIEEKISGIFVDNVQRRSKKVKKDEFIIMNNSKNIEPYNKLLANIKYSSFDKEQKVIMVTSSVVDELKSTICANLAVSMAKNDKKVVILDLDLRKPVMYKYFKVSKKNGLVDYASKKIDLNTLIKKTENNIDIITSGENLINPVVMLESEVLKDLINKLREMYDYVLIDTPPVVVCSDALIISRLVDGVLFNVAMNSTKKSHVKDALQALNNVNANIIGVNLTKYNLKNDSYGYYYYYYSSYAYGEDVNIELPFLKKMLRRKK